jgi:hypothetical protein
VPEQSAYIYKTVLPWRYRDQEHDGDPRRLDLSCTRLISTSCAMANPTPDTWMLVAFVITTKVKTFLPSSSSSRKPNRRIANVISRLHDSMDA